MQYMINSTRAKAKERFPHVTNYIKYKIYKYFTVGRYSTAIVGRKKVKKYIRRTSKVDFIEQYGYKPTKTNLLRDHEFYSKNGVLVPKIIKIKGDEKRPVFYFQRSIDLDQGDTENMFYEMVDISYSILKEGYHFDIMPKNFGLIEGKLSFRDTFGIRKCKDLREELDIMIKKIVKFDRLVFNISTEKKRRFERTVKNYVDERYKKLLEDEKTLKSG
ncbi:MAG: hypothetical protein QF682_07115 [Candidatus Thermoplasmatota archaeon]|nr:hypothetical protein [Candidatus Thermoplasmatota archaeon]